MDGDSLIYEPEESNEHDKYAVATGFDCLLKKVVGLVPLYWSKLAFKFLQFQNHSICVAAPGKRVNRGAGKSVHSELVGDGFCNYSINTGGVVAIPKLGIGYRSGNFKENIQL